jgi:hypothetical protein
VSAIERRRPSWQLVVCAVLAAGFCVVALLRFYRRFVFDGASGRVWGLADDVYISACFGRSLVTGHGFVWYPGAPRVEGITNPLWSMVLGVLHGLPGFTADRLGLFVVVTNALLLMAAAGLFWSALARAGVGRLAPPALVLLFMPASIGLCYWSAEGFEVALVAVFAFGMLNVALTNGTALALGLLLAAGVATRMDFVIVATPALITFALRRGLARAARAALIGGVLIAALLLVRRAYFGAWLPNTYWLKATGWALRARLARGVDQNATLLAVMPVPWLALLYPPLRRKLAPHALAAWLGFALSVLYSCYVGGDAWRPFGGYDRHTAVGGLFLAWGLAAVLSTRIAPRWAHALAWVAASACVIAPIARDDLARVASGLFSRDVPLRSLEREWIAYGKTFAEISKPGARIAICPAGAIVYFSGRGGVDLLGKVDPWVARLPVSTRRPKGNACWRDAPGHNKEDDAGSFERRQPEWSRVHPPPAFRARYVKVKHDGEVFFALPDAVRR